MPKYFNNKTLICASFRAAQSVIHHPDFSKSSSNTKNIALHYFFQLLSVALWNDYKFHLISKGF